MDNQTEIQNPIERERRRLILQELGDAYAEQANDPEFQKEFQAWDVTVGDGI